MRPLTIAGIAALTLALTTLDVCSSVAQEFRPPQIPQFDPQVQPANHVPQPSQFAPQNLQAPQPAPQEPIPLGQRPPSKANAGQPGGSKLTTPRTVREASSGGWSSMFFSLLVVVGLFLGTIWMIKRAMPAPAARLPREVVEVLGCAPLAGRQSAHLVRLGNKLLLVSVFPSGAETLTEITDPVEVDRIAGLCKAQQPNSATASFRSLLNQFGNETPARTRAEDRHA